GLKRLPSGAGLTVRGLLAPAGYSLSDGWGTEDETAAGAPAIVGLTVIAAEPQTSDIVHHDEDARGAAIAADGFHRHNNTLDLFPDSHSMALWEHEHTHTKNK
ncbi:MAG: hypothetical protein ACREQV_02770, partial [Candidatus Binatia bacterium]